MFWHMVPYLVSMLPILLPVSGWLLHLLLPRALSVGKSLLYLLSSCWPFNFLLDQSQWHVFIQCNPQDASLHLPQADLGLCLKTS